MSTQGRERAGHTPMDGRYYAKGQMVFKAPTRKQKPDGSSSISMGFPICEVHEAVADQAEALAGLLNQGEVAPDLLAALQLTQFGFNHSRCPVCAGYNVGPNGETDKVHTKTCPVGTAIAKATGRDE